MCMGMCIGMHTLNDQNTKRNRIESMTISSVKYVLSDADRLRQSFRRAPHFFFGGCRRRPSDGGWPTERESGGTGSPRGAGPIGVRRRQAAAEVRKKKEKLCSTSLVELVGIAPPLAGNSMVNRMT